MRAIIGLISAILLSSGSLIGCGGPIGVGTPPPVKTAAPTVATAAAQNNAVIVSLASTTSGSAIYYTVDGTAPSTASQKYLAPFLVASNLTVKAMASASGDVDSSVTSQAFAPNFGVSVAITRDRNRSGSAGTRQGAATTCHPRHVDFHKCSLVEMDP